MPLTPDEFRHAIYEAISRGGGQSTDVLGVWEAILALPHDVKASLSYLLEGFIDCGPLTHEDADPPKK